MRETIDQAPNQNSLAILADWNAKISAFYVRLVHDTVSTIMEADAR